MHTVLSFYAAKGGVGCSVVAAATAMLASRQQPTLLVDLLGDQPALFGLTATGPGLVDWFEAGAALPDALSRLEVPLSERLSLLKLGADPASSPTPTLCSGERLDTLARLLGLEGRQVVVDVGTTADDARAILGASSSAVLVSRSCYLAVRAAQPLVPPDDVVLIEEQGRALRPRDVAASLGLPVNYVLSWDPAVARVVDAGIMSARLPRSLHVLQGLL